MASVKKSDCISIEEVRQYFSVSRQTVYVYINSLNIQRLRFPFDRQTYIQLADFERIKEMLGKNQ